MRVIRIVTAAVCLLVPQAISTAQMDSVRTTLPEVVLSDFLLALDDTKAFYSAPGSFDSRDWWLATGAVSGSLGSSALDISGKVLIARNQHSPFLYDGAFYAAQYGRVLYASIAAGSVYAAGLLLGNERIRTTGRMLAEAMFLSGSVSLAFQIGLGRDRPYMENGPFHFNGISFKNEHQAFTSGHTTIAFAFSTILANRLDHPIADVVCYGVAALSSAALMYRNQHWISDLVAGMILGIVGANHVIRCEERRSEIGSDMESRWMILPDRSGVQVIYMF